MDNTQNDLQALREIVRDLVARVDRLERRLEVGVSSTVVNSETVVEAVKVISASAPPATAPVAPTFPLPDIP